MYDTLIRPRDLASRAYVALRLPTNTHVRYVGSVIEAHGHWLTQACSCPLCCRLVLAGRRAARYELVAGDGTPGPRHVRHTSVVPCAGEAELEETNIWISTRVTAVHLRRLLRAAFPGISFSVRCGRRDAKGTIPSEITVHWTDGPTRTAVAIVTAPLLGTYGTSTRRLPKWISVTTGGRTHSGAPNVSAIHLVRA